MGLPSVEEATNYLLHLGLAADIGNPGGVMPHLVRPLVAVNLQEATRESRTIVANVCCPMERGRTTCENVAAVVAICWSARGGKCRWGDYRFDSKAAMHIVKVEAVWKKD